MPSLKECVKDEVAFVKYRSGLLYYVCSNNFEFTVPIEDTDGATFMAVDKALYFMRWIKKALEEAK